MHAIREKTARGVGGVVLRYEEQGEGAPTLVCCNGVGVSSFFWKYVAAEFAARHRVVTWDYRGHEASAAPSDLRPEHFTMAVLADDLRAVLDVAGVGRPVLLGHSMGSQVILEFWRRHPHRVAGLVPICGPYGHPVDSLFRLPRLAQLLFEAAYQMTNRAPRLVAGWLRPFLRTRWPLRIARCGAVHPSLASEEDLRPYFEHISEMDPQIFMLMAGEMQRHSAGPWLERIDVPTLVVAGEHDRFTPLEIGLEMSRRIPEAELLVLPEGSHAGLIEHPELLNLRIEKFLRERVEPFVAALSAAEAGKTGGTKRGQGGRGKTRSDDARSKPRKRAKKKSRKQAASDPESSGASD